MVTRLGVEAAEALEQAHQIGIVHRDIKPANLLIDSRAHLWVTDFGLAQVQGDGRLTMTGDLVGTLRYMSPEQALAKPVGVDHRSDIYSLGVTLYELLTLQPAFAGTDRQELLRQIAFDEPALPRRLNKSIPADLETIVLRAIAKLPEERYATAQQLADDLRRFLEDRPVQARRPTAVMRLKKWARRHQAAVATAVVALLLFLTASVAVLGVSYTLIRSERDRANSNASDAAAARATALDNQHQAFETADRLLTRVAEWQLKDVPQMDEARRAILEDALAFYRRFFQKQGDDPEVREQTGKAYARTLSIYQMLGQLDHAEASGRQAVAIQDRLVAEFGEEPRYRLDLGRTLNILGYLRREMGRTTEAESDFRRGLDLVGWVVRERPTAAARFLVTQLRFNLGMLQRYRQGGLDQALESYLQSRRELEELLREEPGNRAYKTDLGKTFGMLALVYRAKGSLKESEESHRQQIELIGALAAERPDDADIQKALARAYNNLGLLHNNTRDYAKAEQSLRQSLAIHERMSQRHPKVVRYALDLGTTYGNLAKAVELGGDATAALECFEQGVPILEQALAQDPRNTESRHALFAVLFDRAMTFKKLGRTEDAARDWARIVEISEGQSHIVMRQWRPPALARIGDHVRATAEVEALLGDAQANGNLLYQFAYTHALAVAAVSHDDRLSPAERDSLAERYGARAVDLLSKARSAGHFADPGRVGHLKTDQDMNAIRHRADFQRLLAEVDAKPSPPERR
jgi:tetratricopeptide (TPR) repeat protein